MEAREIREELRLFSSNAKVLATSFLIGLASGLVTSVFTDAFVYADRFRYSVITNYPQIFVALSFSLILLTAYVLKRFLNTIHGSSTSYVVKAYHWRFGYIGLKELIIYTLGAIASVLAGAVVGPEGPGIALGTFMGYWIARKLGFKGDHLRKLALVGAAAGIASVFRAPLTAMAFAIEVPYKRSLETGVFLPALIATMTSYVITVFLTGPQRLLLDVKPFKPPTPSPTIITYSIAIGVGAAVLTYLMYFIKHFLGGLSDKYAKYWFLFPIALSVLVVVSTFYVSIHVPGSGDVVTEKVFNEPNEFDSATAFSIMVARSALLPLSLTWGATGGLFMPLISIGSLLGLVFTEVFKVNHHIVYPLLIAGISAVFSGAQKTLFTSVLLGVEFLGFGGFFTSTIAAATAYILTLDISLIAGQLPEVQDRKKRAMVELLDKLLSRREVASEMRRRAIEIANKKVTVLKAHVKVKDVLPRIYDDIHEMYPVVDKGWRLIGEVSLDALASEDPETRISEIIEEPKYVFENDTLVKALNVMLEENVDKLYVVDEQMRLLGVLSKTDFLKFALKVILEKILRIRTSSEP